MEMLQLINTRTERNEQTGKKGNRTKRKGDSISNDTISRILDILLSLIPFRQYQGNFILYFSDFILLQFFLT